MDDITLNLLTLAGFLVIGGFIFYFVRRNQITQQSKLEELAHQNHWNLEFIRERLSKGIKISGSFWTLESLSSSSGLDAGPGSSDVEQKTIWFSNKPGDLILIGPKHSKAVPGFPMGGMIKQMIISEMGNEAANIKEIIIGSQSFQNQYMVWANDQEAAEKLLTPAFQSAIMTWLKVPPLIKRNVEGTSIELRGIAINKPEELSLLVELGEKFL